MKRITSVLICLVMCFSMVFPASAQVVKTESGTMTFAHIEVIDTYYASKLPAGYDYKIVFKADQSWFYILYSNTPIITSSSVVYIIGASYDPGGSYNITINNSTKYTVSSVSHSTTSYPNKIVLNLKWALNNSTTTFHIEGIFTNCSTSTFNNQAGMLSSALSKGYDLDFYLSPSVNTSVLISLLTTAKSKQNTGYTSASWQALQTAITAADNLLSITGYTQAQVDAAKNTLQAALDGLTLLPDTSALRALLNQAKAITNDGYNSDTWQALKNAIQNAESVLNQTDYTASQIENALSKLQSAINGLEYLPPVEELKELLVEADAIEDIGYIEPTWNRFETARYNGHALVARVNYTAYEVTSTTTELRVSMDGLTLAVITPPPKPPAPLGFDLASGNISGYLSRVPDIFYNYTVPVIPIAIGLFAIIFSIKLIPYLFGLIIRNLKR